LAGNLFFAFFIFLLSVLVTKICGLETAGVFGLSYTMALNLSQISGFGSGIYQSTDFIKKYGFSDYFTIRLFSSGLIIFLSIIISLVLVNYKKEYFLFCLLSLFFCFHTFVDVFQKLFCQNGRIDMAGKSLFFRTLGSLAAFSIILLYFKSLYFALVGMIAADMFFSIFLNFRPVKDFEKITATTDYSKLFRLLADCFPIFISLFIMQTQLAVPRYLLKFFSSDVILGYFNILFLPLMVIQMIGGFITTPMLPKYADYIKHHHNRKLLKVLFSQGVFLFAVTFIIVIFLHLIGMKILSIIYGYDLLSFKPEITLVMFSGFIFSISILLYNILIIIRKQNLIFIGYSMALIIIILLGFFLIKRFTIIGAVLSFGISCFFLALFFIAVLLRCLKKPSELDAEGVWICLEKYRM
jgi:O-antigen/teichoic acid export membrane protein